MAATAHHIRTLGVRPWLPFNLHARPPGNLPVPPSMPLPPPSSALSICSAAPRRTGAMARRPNMRVPGLRDVGLRPEVLDVVGASQLGIAADIFESVLDTEPEEEPRRLGAAHRRRDRQISRAQLSREPGASVAACRCTRRKGHVDFEKGGSKLRERLIGTSQSGVRCGLAPAAERVITIKPL